MAPSIIELVKYSNEKKLDKSLETLNSLKNDLEKYSVVLRGLTRSDISSFDSKEIEAWLVEIIGGANEIHDILSEGQNSESRQEK